MKTDRPVLAIVPARSGSKRIPGKNIKPFAKIPMIERTIATLLETKLFDHVVVTTDCHETTEISHRAGASRCILRPLHLADDHTPTKPVIQHAIEELKLDLSTAVCCVYPCNPFLKNTTLKKCYDLVIQNHEYFCFPVIEYPHPIQRAFTLDQRSMVTRREPEFVKWRTQDLEPCYHDAGSFYWGTSSMWMSDLEVHEQSLGIPVARTEGLDIDTTDDWSFAELLYEAEHAGGPA